MGKTDNDTMTCNLEFSDKDNLYCLKGNSINAPTDTDKDILAWVKVYAPSWSDLSSAATPDEATRLKPRMDSNLVPELLHIRSAIIVPAFIVSTIYDEREW